MASDIKTVFQFNAALSIGPYAWPGGYPFYFLQADGEALCFKCGTDNAGLIRDAIIDYSRFGQSQEDWRTIGMFVNWEDHALHCANCNCLIESAYPDVEEPIKQPVCVVAESSLEIIHRCESVSQAESFIENLEKTDPKGVHAGAYSIDAPDEPKPITYWTHTVNGRTYSSLDLDETHKPTTRKEYAAILRKTYGNLYGVKIEEHKK